MARRYLVMAFQSCQEMENYLNAMPADHYAVSISDTNSYVTVLIEVRPAIVSRLLAELKSEMPEYPL